MNLHGYLVRELYTSEAMDFVNVFFALIRYYAINFYEYSYGRKKLLFGLKLLNMQR